jgi:hypothetical protein
VQLSNYFDSEVLLGVRQIILGPVHTPELIPTLMPIILGGVVLELYFGKHKNESLGWNSSVSNSVIWISTGITLYLTADIATFLERAVTYFLISIGFLTGYLNFFHKWSSTVAFLASSSGMVYSLAYVAVVMIKSGIPVNSITIQSAILALTVIAVTFQVIKFLEPPAKDDFAVRPPR